MDSSEEKKINNESPDASLETSATSTDIGATQKIDFNVREVIGESTMISRTSTRSRILETPSPKKSIFAKKYIPDEFVKSDSKVFAINSIPKLENQLKLEDIKSNYSLNEQIAEGAQSTVWTAFDKSLRREIIVKSSKSAEKEEFKNSKNLFVSEARIMAQLDHPSIAPIYGMYSGSEDKLHLTMKHIHGQTLQDYLDNIIALYERDGIDKFDERKSIANRIEDLIKVCEAVNYAHCKGVIHRDLKPENIIVGTHGEVYVMDWGLACLMDPDDFADDKHITEIGRHMRNELVGTPCYLAPELIRGGLCNPQSDIFSLGMILFEIITLKKAAVGETIGEVLKNIAHGNYHPFRHRFLKSKLPKDLKAIFRKATCNSLSKRYKTANDMANDLKNYLRNNEITARPDNFLRKWIRAIGHHALMAYSTILCLLFCATIIVIYGLNNKNAVILEQKVQKDILAHFSQELFERANGISSAFTYLESQLIDSANHAELLLNIDDNSLKHITLAESIPQSNNYFYSQAHGAMIDTNHASFRDKLNRKIEISDKKILALYELLKFTLLASDLKFSKINSINKVITDKKAPIIWTYIVFDDGSILSYPDEKNYGTVCRHCKRSFSEKISDQKTVWSQPFNCSEHKKTLLACRKYIHDNKNRQQGVIGMDIDINFLKGLMHKNIEPEVTRYLLNRKGEIILSTDPKYTGIEVDNETKNITLQKFPFNKNFQKSLTEDHMQFEATCDGNIYIFGMRHIKNIDYYYIEQIERKMLQDKHLGHRHK